MASGIWRSARRLAAPFSLRGLKIKFMLGESAWSSPATSHNFQVVSFLSFSTNELGSLKSNNINSHIIDSSEDVCSETNNSTDLGDVPNRMVNLGNQQHSADIKFTGEKLFLPFTTDNDRVYESGTFQYLFENSQFVKALDPVGKEVEAEIIAVVGDKLYVDFGCKFHAVVSRPEGQEKYCIGAKVIVIVKDLEITDHFIGDSKHRSLLEAEVKLVRLVP